MPSARGKGRHADDRHHPSARVSFTPRRKPASRWEWPTDASSRRGSSGEGRTSLRSKGRSSLSTMTVFAVPSGRTGFASATSARSLHPQACSCLLWSLSKLEVASEQSPHRGTDLGIDAALPAELQFMGTIKESCHVTPAARGRRIVQTQVKGSSPGGPRLRRRAESVTETRRVPEPGGREAARLGPHPPGYVGGVGGGREPAEPVQEDPTRSQAPGTLGGVVSLQGRLLALQDESNHEECLRVTLSGTVSGRACLMLSQSTLS